MAVRVLLRSNQADSRPGAQEGLVPYLVDLAERDLVDLAERNLVGLEVWVPGDLVMPALPDLGFGLARSRMAVDPLACWEESPLMEDLRVVAKVDLRHSKQSSA